MIDNLEVAGPVKPRREDFPASGNLDYFSAVRKYNDAVRCRELKAGAHRDVRGNSAEMQDRWSARKARDEFSDAVPETIPTWLHDAVRTLPRTKKLDELCGSLQALNDLYIKTERQIADLEADDRAARQTKIESGKDSTVPSSVALLLFDKQRDLDAIDRKVLDTAKSIRLECERILTDRLTELDKCQILADAAQLELRWDVTNALVSCVESAAALGFVPSATDFSPSGLVHFIWQNAPLLSASLSPVGKTVVNLDVATIQNAIDRGHAKRASLPAAETERQKFANPRAADAFVDVLIGK